MYYKFTRLSNLAIVRSVKDCPFVYYKFTWFSNSSYTVSPISSLLGYYKFTWFSNSFIGSVASTGLLGYYKFTWLSNLQLHEPTDFSLLGYYKFTWFSNQIHMILNWMKLAYTKLKHCPFHILYTRLHDSQTRDDVWRWYSCLLSITNLHDSQTQRIHHNLNNSFWVLQIYIILKLYPCHRILSYPF